MKLTQCYDVLYQIMHVVPIQFLEKKHFKFLLLTTIEYWQSSDKSDLITQTIRPTVVIHELNCFNIRCFSLPFFASLVCYS